MLDIQQRAVRRTVHHLVQGVCATAALAPYDVLQRHKVCSEQVTPPQRYCNGAEKLEAQQYGKLYAAVRVVEGKYPLAA